MENYEYLYFILAIAAILVTFSVAILVYFAFRIEKLLRRSNQRLFDIRALIEIKQRIKNSN
ncbi:MAG: hypothetical protein NT007_14010 [Candidatus Kapabacteria bacterium]|nr:hypothetical protein [Candidatus Kapabacteria bacterium]